MLTLLYYFRWLKMLLYMKNQFYFLNNLMSSKMHYFDVNFNIYIDLLEIQNSNEINIVIIFWSFFWLLIIVNYKILVLLIQNTDFVISEINSHIYQYKKLFGWIHSETLMYLPYFKDIHNIAFVNSTFPRRRESFNEI